MTPLGDTGQSHDLASARVEAAALFAAAARHAQATTTVQLHCLAASTALRVPTRPVPAGTDADGPDQLITRALRILGQLDTDDFAHPDVLAAARHGRRALREAH
jgi:hypothetical protein